jgi:tetratricopeptide (TPR) repeat protein
VTRIRPAYILLLLIPSLAFAGDFERGVEALEKKDHDKAIACFDAHIRRNPKSASAYYNRGVAYAFKKNYAKAVSDFTETIRLNPLDVDAYVNRGTAYSFQGDYDKAFEDYDQAINLDPLNADNYYRRGLAHARRKDCEKAILDHDQAIALDPKHVPAYFDRGLCYAWRKRYGEALADLNEANRLDPSNADISGVLAWILATCPTARFRDGKRAVEYAKKACKLSGWKDPSCLEALAAAHAECGDFEAAVRWQTKVIDLRSDEKAALARAQRGLKLYEQGKPYRMK